MLSTRYSCQILMKLEFSRISDLMKIRQAGAELFHTVGQTDMTNLMAAFRNFCESA